MITQLAPEDIGRSVPFYRAFRREIAVPYPRLFEPGPDGLAHYLRAWEALIRSGLGAIFLAEPDAGILLGTVTPDLFDGVPVATEHAWYVMPEARGGRTGGELIGAYETWAIGRGARRLVMSHFIEGMPDLEPYFRKRGYAPLEKHYLATIG